MLYINITYFFIAISEYNSKYNEDEQGYIIFEEDANNIFELHKYIKNIEARKKGRFRDVKKSFEICRL